MARKRPVIGDRAWRVEWCADLPVDAAGDSDTDMADNRCEVWLTKPAAQKRATEVLPLDVFGQVSITPVEFVPYDENDAIRYPHVGFWEEADEPIFLESE